MVAGRAVPRRASPRTTDVGDLTSWTTLYFETAGVVPEGRAIARPESTAMQVRRQVQDRLLQRARLEPRVARTEARLRPYRPNAGMAGVLPVLTESMAYRGATGDWVLTPSTRQPLVAQRRFPLPDAVRGRLARMLADGVEFDRTVLLLPAREPDATDFCPPPALAACEFSRRLGLVGLGLTAAAAAPALAVAAASLVTGLLGAAGAAGLGALSVDPFLFGLIELERQRSVESGLAAYFLLAQWDYEGAGL